MANTFDRTNGLALFDELIQFEGFHQKVLFPLDY